MVGQPQQTTQRYSCTIATSDPVSGTIEALLPGQLKPVMVRDTPVAFRWPIAGETWWIQNINGTFCLLAPVPIQNNGSSDATTAQGGDITTINDVAPGDVVINSPTGKIWVLGDNTGVNDYSFDASSFGGGGAPGARWFTYSGSGTPTGITGEINGDFCLRHDGEVFERVSGAWVDQSIDLKGPTGTTGATGLTGAQGIPGPTGPAGSAGSISATTTSNSGYLVDVGNLS